MRFIFEPDDDLTLNDIKEEIKNVVKKYMPKLQIDETTIAPSTDSEYAVVVTIKYTVTDDVFTSSDIIVVKL